MVAKNNIENKNTTTTTVPKRKKVSKACDSCRRRKIKCTGTQPCMNCQLHQCTCIFSNNSSTTTSTTSTTTSTTTSNMIKKKGVRLPRISTKLDNLKNNNNTESTGDSSSSTTTTSTSTTFDRNVPHTSSLYKVDLNDDNNNNNDNDNDKKTNPELNEFENGLYEGDIEDLPKYNEYKQTIEKLTSIPNKNKMIESMISDLNDKINDLILNWQPKINLLKLPKLLKVSDPIDASKSIETQLMINKYRNRIHLSRYSHWSFNSRNEKFKKSTKREDYDKCDQESHISPIGKEGGYLNSVPLIDEIFGLYHPCEALSLRGIAYLTQKYSVLRPKGKGKSQIIRANVFLLLRFFDLCWLHMNEDRISMANPLESYLQRTKGISSTGFPSATSPQNSITSSSTNNNYNYNNGATGQSNIPTPSTPAVSNTNNKEMVLSILRTLPSGFLEHLTPDNVTKLLDNIEDDLGMFKLLLEICGNNKDKIESFLRWISPPNKSNVNPQDLERCNKLIGVHELLLTLCYSYYNTTMYYLVHMDSLDYLELLLDMLDYEDWAKEIYGFDKILNVAINCALKAGFSRWEYYVGFDEETAERRRRVWWRLYMYDKKVMMEDSYMSGIDDSKMNCLLPKEFRDMGFVDHNDFIKKLHLFSRTSTLDNLPIDQLVFYASLSTYQVISHFYSEVLYNEKYTSIRNTAKPNEVRTRLIGELFGRMGLFVMRFDKIKEQVGRLFEIAENINEPQFSNVSDKDKQKAVAFAFEYTALYCLVTRVSINIGIRISVHPKPPYIKERIMALSKSVYDKWVTMNKTLLQLETSYDLWRVIEHYTYTFLLMITWMYDECAYIEHSDIIEVINVFERLSELKDVFILSNNSDRQTLRFFSSLFTLFCIMTRILLTEYVGLDRMNSDDISKIFAKEGPHIVELVKIIFDGNSYCYQLVLTPLEESIFHTSVKKMLKSDYDIKVEETPAVHKSYRGSPTATGSTRVDSNEIPNKPFSRSVSEQVLAHPTMSFDRNRNDSQNFPSTNSETGTRNLMNPMVAQNVIGVPIQSPSGGGINPGMIPPSRINQGFVSGLGPGPSSGPAMQNKISNLLQTEIMDNPLLSHTPPLPSLNNTNNTLLYPPNQPNGKRQESSPQIGYIDKRLFQPFDLGILEDFFSSTDFTDLGSL